MMTRMMILTTMMKMMVSFVCAFVNVEGVWGYYYRRLHTSYEHKR